MSKLLAASGTKEAMIKTITRYYCGSTISLHETSPGIFEVSNKKGVIKGARVVLIKGRYRFEDTEPEFTPVDTGEELPQLSFAPKPDQQLRLI